MRHFGWGVIGFALGGAAGWAALVFGWIAYWEVTDAPDRERAGILAVMFGIGPLVALVTGTIAAVLVRRRVRCADSARMQTGLPPRRWPAAIRCVFGAVLGFLVGFVVAVMVMRIVMPVLYMPDNASAPLHLLPVAIALTTAILAGWRGVRTRAT
jgi:uncharacterized protein YqgC (DUF456 family)